MYLKRISEQKLNSITFNNSSGEKYFSFLIDEKIKGKGVMLFSGEKRYVVLYASAHKTKNSNRFTSSFLLNYQDFREHLPLPLFAENQTHSAIFGLDPVPRAAKVVYKSLLSKARSAEAACRI